MERRREHFQGAMLFRLRAVARRGLCTNAPPAATDAIRALYRRGSGRRKVGPGQPRVVALVTGGGGSLFSWMLSEAGASSCLLEGRVPYAKESLVAFLAEHNRTIDGIGFCSAPMAGRMAEAARDRGLMLTQKLDQWPDVIGVASTATIVSLQTMPMHEKTAEAARLVRQRPRTNVPALTGPQIGSPPAESVPEMPASWTVG